MAKHEAVAGKTKIVGRIERCDGKSLTVTRGQQTIHVDLADIPTINVELSDLKLVQDSKDSSKNRVEGKGASGHAVSILVSDLVGAKIVVQGTAAETKSKRQCMAKSIEVTLAKPLTSKKSTSSEAKKTMPEPRPGPAAGASEGR
jgi:fructose-specific phosphotransferase system component IIB